MLFISAILLNLVTLKPNEVVRRSQKVFVLISAKLNLPFICDLVISGGNFDKWLQKDKY